MRKTKLNVENIDSDFLIHITYFNFLNNFYYIKLKPYLFKTFSKKTPFGVQFDTNTEEYKRFKRCWQLCFKRISKQLYSNRRQKSITKKEVKKIMKYGEECIKILNIRD